MQTDTRAATQVVFPFLRYSDAAAAIRWLSEVFGFRERMSVSGPDGGIVHAELELDGAVVMLGSAGDERLRMASPRDLPAVNQGVYVCLGEVDAHHARAEAAGAEVVIGLADTPYGSREYTARDPEGHLWSFGTYRPAAGG